MEKSKYLDLNRIEFVTTYHCTGRCKHCSAGKSLNRPGPHHVPVKESVEAIRWLRANYPITSLMTFGGEPLLCPKAVCTLHSAARDCGIQERSVITNGYFSKRPEAICRAAQDLIDAGVNDILLSVDAFHQEIIPLEPVLVFARYVAKNAPGVLKLSPAWVVNEACPNAWNEQTRGILAQFAELRLPICSGNDIFMAGNAAENLAPYYPAPCLDLNETCGALPYTEPLDQIRSLSIEPDGSVKACALPIGNLLEDSIAAITGRYNPYDDERSRALLTGGAKALLELAQEKQIPVDLSQCWSVCDLCGQVNQGYHKS